MELQVVIPALNEEQSIAAIIERTLASVPEICRVGGITNVHVTVVSDGSTDRTAAIARQYQPEICVIEFEKNKGYGAAIKAGWQSSDAALLGFLDADGTCDPAFFGPLCAALTSDRYDVALGCRMTDLSEMPRVRRFGNRAFALLLQALSSTSVRDTASGMRVVRRTSLPQLMPLPDGLHFTPAMSARVMLSRRLKLIELDMPYAEREGESKLHVVRDGGRFLRAILQAAILFRPSRVLGLVAAALGVASVVIGLPAVTTYFGDGFQTSRRIVPSVVIAALLSSGAITVALAGYLAGRVVERLFGLDDTSTMSRVCAAVLRARWFWLIPPALCAVGFASVTSRSRVMHVGTTPGHWLRYILLTWLVGVAINLSASRLLDRFIELLKHEVVRSHARQGATG